MKRVYAGGGLSAVRMLLQVALREPAPDAFAGWLSLA